MLVKICGITNAEHARCVQRCGADFLGLVFVATSKRYVTPPQAKDILAELTGPTQPVGVFEDHDPRAVADTARELALPIVQLHGHEEPAYVDQLVRELPACRFLKAFAYTGPDTLDGMSAWHDGLADPDRLLALLLDGPWGGGEGRSFDWSELVDVLHWPRYGIVREKLFLAGGLNSQNVRQAITMLRPIGVDVSSGVESRPGTKDPRRIEQFVALANAND